MIGLKQNNDGCGNQGNDKQISHTGSEATEEHKCWIPGEILWQEIVRSFRTKFVAEDFLWERERERKWKNGYV